MKLLTIEQAARQLATSERAVERLLSTGQLSYVDVAVSTTGKKQRKRVCEDDLLAFIERRRVQQEGRGIRDKRRKTLSDPILRLL